MKAKVYKTGPDEWTVDFTSTLPPHGLGSMKFETLNEAMEALESAGVGPEMNEAAMGYVLGLILVSLAGKCVSKEKILDAMNESTDSAWAGFKSELIQIVNDFTG